MIGSASWSALGTVRPDDLTEARLLAHHAAQWPTRAARAALDPAHDDSHTNLGWDAAHAALVTHPFGDTSIALRVADLTLLHLGTDDRLALDGRVDADAEGWLRNVLSAIDASEKPAPTNLPYELPYHSVAAGGRYDGGSNADALAELSNWFASADDALKETATAFAQAVPGPSAVRCWPHHFDIAMLIRLEEGDPEQARAIGVGLSPGDDTYGQPYFYVNPWPVPEANDLPDLPTPGHWHTEGFVGAVALAEGILTLRDRRSGTLEFLRGAIKAGRDLLAV